MLRPLGAIVLATKPVRLIGAEGLIGAELNDDHLSLLMADGWVYCISNPSMPGLLKIGMTLRTPQERLKEANSSDTWRPPTNFIIEFAKRVHNPLQKERTLHTLLEQYDQRVNPKREFFEVNIVTARLCFELMDGEWLADVCEPGQALAATQAKHVAAATQAKVKAPSAPRVPKAKAAKATHASLKADLPTVLHTLPIRGLVEAEAECLLSIALDTHRIHVHVNGITYPYQVFDTVNPTWLHQKTANAFLCKDETKGDIVCILTNNIDEIIMLLSQNNNYYVVLDIV